MEAEFDIIATKVLAGEATPEERAQLDALLARDAARRSEFAELQTAWETVRKLSPLMRSLQPPPAPLPEHRLRELQRAVEKHSSSKPRQQSDDGAFFKLLWAGLNARRLFAGAVAAAVLAGGLFFLVRDRGDSATLAYLVADQGRPEIVRHGNPLTLTTTVALQKDDQIRLAAGDAVRVLTPAGSLPLKGPQRLRAEKLDALVAANRVSPTRPVNKSAATVQIAPFRPLKQLPPMLAVMRDTQAIALYSPRDATRSLTPLILWKTEPGKTYDLTISDEFDRAALPWQLRNVVSPVDFGKVEAWKGRPLAKDGLYRIVIREAGNPISTCEYTFRTLKDANGTLASTPADKITRAYQLLVSETPCPGDALAELLTLPLEFAESELALRLKLALFGQLRLQADYEATAAKLNPPSDTRRR